MSDPARPEGPRLTEARLAEELERVGGVLAASVRLVGAEVRDLFIAAADDAAGPAIRDAVAEIVGRAGLTLPGSALHIGAVRAVAPAEAAPASSSDPQPGPAPWQSRFLLLDNVQVQRADARVTCKVDLVRLDVRFQGECSELDSELGRARAAARATLDAAEKSSPAALALEGAQITELFGRRYIVVSVEASAARRFVVLSGILALDGARSLEEAAALAALRAVERFISW